MAYGKMKKEARKKMLRELKNMMKDDMHEDMREKMKGMQKVTVASDSPEGLEMGLSKAQKILKKRKEMDEYKDGGYKESKDRTSEAPDSLGEGQGEYRGYKEDPKPYDRKKPEYWDHRKMKPARMKGKYYKEGGYKQSKEVSKTMKKLMEKAGKITSKDKTSDKSMKYNKKKK